MVPSSPKGPCRSGKTTSTAPSSWGTSLGEATINWCSPPISARVTVWADGDTSGNDEAAKDHCAVSAGARTHCPVLAIPIGMTSYLSLLMAPSTPAAVTQLTACSLERPPNNTATRGFLLLAVSPVVGVSWDMVSN